MPVYSYKVEAFIWGCDPIPQWLITGALLGNVSWPNSQKDYMYVWSGEDWLSVEVGAVVAMDKGGRLFVVQSVDFFENYEKDASL